MRRLAVFSIDTVLRIFGVVANLVFYLSGWRFLSFTGSVIGNVIYFLNSRNRKKVEEELKEVFGDRFDRVKIGDITKRAFEDYYKRLVETVFFGSFDSQMLNRMISIEGMENLDFALSIGRGVILLLSHFGSFLLPLPFLGYKGYKVNQLTGRQIHTSLLAERVWLWREKEANRLPVKFIQVDKFLRPVYKALRSNELVAIAFDGRDGSNWAAVDLFERRVSFSTGPFELARRTGATIIPTFIVRNEDNTHKLIMESPFKISDHPDPDKAAAADIKNYTDIFADYLGRYPCHFAMVLPTLNI